jgi:very-short-patch-repair endonuclease
MFTHHNYNPNLKEYARELRSQTVSKAEKRIWKSILSSKKLNGERVLRQRPIDRFIVDFFIPELKLIIEIDGNSHYRKPEYDFYRQERLIKLGYTIIRFTEGQVINQLDHVHQQLLHAILCKRSELSEDK